MMSWLLSFPAELGDGSFEMSDNNDVECWRSPESGPERVFPHLGEKRPLPSLIDIVFPVEVVRGPGLEREGKNIIYHFISFVVLIQQTIVWF